MRYFMFRGPGSEVREVADELAMPYVTSPANFVEVFPTNAMAEVPFKEEVAEVSDETLAEVAEEVVADEPKKKLGRPKKATEPTA